MPIGVPEASRPSGRIERRPVATPAGLSPAGGADEPPYSNFRAKMKGRRDTSEAKISMAQNGFTITRTTIPTISRVGTSLAMR